MALIPQVAPESWPADPPADLPAESPPAVLAGFDRDVLLATGRAVRVRPSKRSDVPAMRAFYDCLSDRSAYSRFFGLRPARLDDYLHPAEGLDVSRCVVLLAIDGDELIGVGDYHALPGRPEAEVAFAVADDHHHEGIATVLLEDLAMIAREAGLSKLVAETLAGNNAMLEVFRSVGLTKHSWYDSGQVHVELDLTGESLLEERSDGRDWIAAVASLEPILRPRHVVVVGAGRNAASPGRTILANLLSEFRGRVSVVHPEAPEIGGVATVGRIGDLDTVPDLAVIAVPAAYVGSVVDECGQAGVRAAVVVSAGFAEEGRDGIDRERALLATARRHGMRIVGPNCLGIVSTPIGLNATFLRRPLRSGSIAIASQSGGVGVVIADETGRRELGVSAFVSMGNKADVSGNDVLRYWADDPNTRVVLMYLESIGDPRRFARIARTVSRRVPVVALKGGRSVAGQRAAQSHTAALAADDAGVDALFAHTGVIRATTLDQLLDVGALLATQPAPAGRRVALIGNAGGPLILAADAAAEGLEVVQLSEPLQARLRKLVPDAASTSNPVDLLATATPVALSGVADIIAGSGEVDACMIVNVNLAAGIDAPALQLDWSNPAIPAVAVLMGGAPAVGTMPTFATPERAIDALALAAKRGAWLASTTGDEVTVESVDLLAVRRRARPFAHAARRTDWLEAADTFGLLTDLGIPVVPWQTASTTAADCVRKARDIGFPCVLKADVSGTVHKSDEGAVVVGVSSAAAVLRTVAMFRERFGDRLNGVLVQHQATAGVELLVGGVRDPAIGPLVVVAAGGTDAEVLGDRRVVLAPLTRQRAQQAVEGLRMFPLLTGFRGRPIVPIEPIVDVVERIGLLMAAVPEISELDLNPVIASPDGCIVVDARIAVAAPVVQPLRALRPPRQGTKDTGCATPASAS